MICEELVFINAQETEQKNTYTIKERKKEIMQSKQSIEKNQRKDKNNDVIDRNIF